MPASGDRRLTPILRQSHWLGWNRLRAQTGGKFHALIAAVSRAMAHTSRSSSLVETLKPPPAQHTLPTEIRPSQAGGFRAPYVTQKGRSLNHAAISYLIPRLPQPIPLWYDP